MDAIKIKEYIGKKCLIVLKNGFKYTCIIPPFENSSFSFIDKFGEKVEVDCDFISLIKEGELSHE